VDEQTDDRAEGIESLGEAEVAALAMLGLGALDDADAERTDDSTASGRESRPRKKYEIPAMLGWCIVMALGLAVLLVFWFYGIGGEG
jgi:hypothetical protein